MIRAAVYGQAPQCGICRAPTQTNIASLRVNVGMRDAIQRMVYTPPVIDSAVLTPFISAPCTVSMQHAAAPGGQFQSHIIVTPPATGERQRKIVIIYMDVSGSMTTSLPNPTSEKGVRCFTRLDVAKHVLNSTAHMLGENDYLCVIAFNSTATVVLKPTLMNDAGKTIAGQTIKKLRADGGTDIWSALALGNKISSKPEFAGCNVVSALLTDGETEINPACARRGIVETYERLVRPEKLSVFGFGYSINSKLLSQMATVGGGNFGFIPDGTMVGTVFTNWVATMLATASLERKLTVTYADGSVISQQTGLIQFGQPLDFVSYNIANPVSVVLDAEPPVASVEVEVLSLKARARFDYLNLLQYAIANEGRVDFSQLYTTYANCADQQVKEMMRDIKPAGSDDQGQISLAVSCPEFWNKWGKHYVRSYLTAMLRQVCLNFKDPGLQIYGGELFQTLSDAGDKIFISLPSPEATGNMDVAAIAVVHSVAAGGGGAAPAPPRYQPPTMAAFHNAGGGCWAPGTMVLMSDGVTRVAIENVRRNDMVWTPTGPAVVEHAIEMNRFAPTQLMCNHNGVLLITPWHPVKVNNVWCQPADFLNPVDMSVRTVYNMVLSLGHVIDVNGILSCTLGHNFTGDVIQHDFFGNKERILAALSQQPGYDVGRPVFANLVAVKDVRSGLITGWIDAI